MATSSYDVIVMGDELAGLLAGALCGRRGLRVLVAQQSGATPDKYTVGPYAFAPTPFSLPLAHSSAVRRIIDELNLTQSLKRRLVDLTPPFQWVLPDARIDVTSDPDGFARELAREFPEHQEALLSFVDKAREVSKVIEPVLGAPNVSVPPSGFWEKRELGYSDAKLPAADVDFLPGVPSHHPLRAAIRLPAAFSLALDPRTLTPTAIARAFDLWRRGGTLLEGGQNTLRHLLIDKLRRQHAADIRPLRGGQLHVGWNKASGLSVPGSKEDLDASAFLCATSLDGFATFFHGKPPKRLSQGVRAIVPSAYRYVLHLVMSEAGVPEGLGKVAFVLRDPRQPLIDDNAFAVYAHKLEEDDRVLVTLVANAAAPAQGESLSDAFGELRKKLLSHLETILNFSPSHARMVHSPNEARPPTGLKIKEAPTVLAAIPLWQSSLPAALGVGAAPYDIGLKNVAIASTQNLPGLGVEGDFVAAWCAARYACAATGKKKDYLKDEVLFGS